MCFLHSIYMEDKRFVCICPEKYYCGNPSCPLSHLCRSKPLADKNFVRDMHGKRNRVRKTEDERKEHQRLYNMYNRLFGDLTEKRSEYYRKWYKENRTEILRKRKKPYRERRSVVMECSHDCFNCPYEDCVEEGFGSHEEYMALYYRKFREKILEQQAVYRENNRILLANSGKLRNYRKRGYRIIPCTCNETEGMVCFIKINGKDYVSFISSDRLFSFREKVVHFTEDDNEIRVSTRDNTILFFKKLQQ